MVESSDVPGLIGFNSLMVKLCSFWDAYARKTEKIIIKGNNIKYHLLKVLHVLEWFSIVPLTMKPGSLWDAYPRKTEGPILNGIRISCERKNVIELIKMIPWCKLVFWLEIFHFDAVNPDDEIVIQLS